MLRAPSVSEPERFTVRSNCLVPLIDQNALTVRLLLRWVSLTSRRPLFGDSLRTTGPFAWEFPGRLLLRRCQRPVHDPL